MTLNVGLESVCYGSKYRFQVVESLSTHQISRILSLSTESNAMDPIVTKEIGISKLSSHSAAVSTAEIVFYSIKRGKELFKDS